MEFQQQQQQQSKKENNPIRLPKIVESREHKKLATPARLSMPRRSSPSSTGFRETTRSRSKPSITRHHLLPRLSKSKLDRHESLDKSLSMFSDDLNDSLKLSDTTRLGQLITEEEDQEESYESFMTRFHEREDSPLEPSQIWSSKMINTKRVVHDSRKKIKEKLKLASFMSDEAVYALLKSYEDLIYQELRRIYPMNEKITRMNTQAYIKLPKLGSARSRNDQLPAQQDDDLKREYVASQQLQRAMEIFDEIKRRKGEVTGRSSYQTNDLIGDYEKWKKNCYSKLKI